MQKTNRWRAHLEGTQLPLYSLGYFDSSTWGREGTFTGTNCRRRGIASTGATAVAGTATRCLFFGTMLPVSTSSANWRGQGDTVRV